MSNETGGPQPTQPTGTTEPNQALALAALPRWVLPTSTGVAGVILGGLIVGLGGIFASGLADAQATASKQTVFESVLNDCSLKDDSNSEIADGGYTLTVQSRGEDDATGLGYSDLQCILDKINTPQAVLSHFGQTTSLDGRQSESWDGFTLSWSYHPDRGADFIVTIDREG